MHADRTVAIALTVLLAAAGSAPAQDAARGKDVFRKCASCHMIGEAAKNRTGPVLTGVIGRPAGSHEGFHYGASMTAAGGAGLVWSEERIFDYLENPSDYLRAYLGDPGARAKMTFRLKDAQDRRDVIAYLASFGTTGTAALAAPEGALADAEPEPRPGQVCVVNASPRTLLFAVEAGAGSRRVAELAPAGELCTQVSGAVETGMVSVFESAEALEGCSRLVPAGMSEPLLKYVDFDRCFWGSNS